MYILPAYISCLLNDAEKRMLKQQETIRSWRLKRSQFAHSLFVTRDKLSHFTNSTLTFRPLVSTGVTAFGTHISKTTRPTFEVKEFPSTIEQLRNLKGVITRD